MKLNPQQIEQAINSLPNKYKAVLIYGPDAGLVSEKSEIIISKLFKGKIDLFNLIEISAIQLKEFNVILNEINNLSFFGGLKVIKITNLIAAIPSVLKEVFEYNLNGNFLVLIADDLTTSSSLRKFAEAHADILTIPCYKDDIRSIETIVRDYFNKYNIKFESEVPNLVAGYLIGDRLLLRTELEKISIFIGNNYLTVKLAESILANCSELQLDQLILNYFNKDFQNFINELSLAFNEASNVGVVRMMIKHCFKLLEIIKISETQAISFKQAITLAKPPIFFKHQPMIEKQLSLWKKTHLDQLLKQLYYLEKLCKSNDYLEIIMRENITNF